MARSSLIVRMHVDVPRYHKIRPSRDLPASTRCTRSRSGLQHSFFMKGLLVQVYMLFSVPRTRFHVS